MRYLWAAYKKGAFDQDSFIPLEEGMSIDDFEQVFSSVINEAFDDGWILQAINNGKIIPIGILFSANAGQINVISELTWLPWATSRNRIESFVNFINESRKKMLLTWVSEKSHTRFSEHISRHGIAKRVGSIDWEKGQSAFWQSKF